MGIFTFLSLATRIQKKKIIYFSPNAHKCEPPDHQPRLCPRCSAPFSFLLTLLTSFLLFFSLPNRSGSATASTLLFLFRSSLLSRTRFCTSPMTFKYSCVPIRFCREFMISRALSMSALYGSLGSLREVEEALV